MSVPRPGVAGDADAAAVAARGLYKAYGASVAVDRIDFTVRRGECVGFLGPNGAGKTTTMKMIYGLAAVDGGEMRVFGHDVARHPRRSKAQLGVVPQHENLDGELTVRENLLVQAGYHGLRTRAAAARADELLVAAGLRDRGGDRPEQLSGGMKRRLALARSLVGRPSLIVLDEPTTGLDPQARQTIWAALGVLRAEGVTLVLTTHYMEEAARVCDRIVIMDKGRIVDHGVPDELVLRHGQSDLEGVFLHLTGEELAA